jgi:hypothetical protein
MNLIAMYEISIINSAPAARLNSERNTKKDVSSLYIGNTNVISSSYLNDKRQIAHLCMLYVVLNSVVYYSYATCLSLFRAIGMCCMAHRPCYSQITYNSYMSALPM